MIRSYSIHNGGSKLKCVCGNHIDMKTIKKRGSLNGQLPFVCPLCMQKYTLCYGVVLMDD